MLLTLEVVQCCFDRVVERDHRFDLVACCTFADGVADGACDYSLDLGWGSAVDQELWYFGVEAPVDVGKDLAQALIQCGAK